MSEFLLWGLVAFALILVGLLLGRARRREQVLEDETSRLRERIYDLEQQIADARAGWTLADERLEELAEEMAELRDIPRERPGA